MATLIGLFGLSLLFPYALLLVGILLVVIVLDILANL